MATNTSTKRDDWTLGEMFAELSREARALVYQEIQLAKTELGDKASKMGTGAALVVGGGLLAYAGLLGVVAGLILGLVTFGLSAWASALFGGILVIGAGYVLIRSGLSSLRAQGLKPTETIKTLKENAQWLKTQTK